MYRQVRACCKSQACQSCIARESSVKCCKYSQVCQIGSRASCSAQDEERIDKVKELDRASDIGMLYRAEQAIEPFRKKGQLFRKAARKPGLSA